MIVAGVDEAGRGSVLGPLVVAGVAIDDDHLPKLTELGVKDSKLLSPNKRRELSRAIKKVTSAIVVYERVEPSVIDSVVFRGERLFRLNYLEARAMANVLARLDFDRAVVDCCDTNQKRFGYLISDLIAEIGGKRFTVGERNPLFDKIKSEHHADRNHPVVSAASIIAKVTRDSAIKRLQKRHGCFGSGYPSDPVTIAFLRNCYEKKSFPSFARMSWLTIRRMRGEAQDADSVVNALIREGGETSG
jgi:ribonuclease HII